MCTPRTLKCGVTLRKSEAATLQHDVPRLVGYCHAHASHTRPTPSSIGPPTIRSIDKAHDASVPLEGRPCHPVDSIATPKAQVCESSVGRTARTMAAFYYPPPPPHLPLTQTAPHTTHTASQVFPFQQQHSSRATRERARSASFGKGEPCAASRAATASKQASKQHLGTASSRASPVMDPRSNTPSSSSSSSSSIASRVVVRRGGERVPGVTFRGGCPPTCSA